MPKKTEKEKRVAKKSRPLVMEPSSVSKEMPHRYFYAVGRRKEAVAIVRLYPTKGEIKVNGKALADYFPHLKLQNNVLLPFSELKLEPLQIEAKVRGGGIVGQADALRLGISRALAAFRPEFAAHLRKRGLLTRDARVKERRKYGLKKARRAPQWQKR